MRSRELLELLFHDWTRPLDLDQTRRESDPHYLLVRACHVDVFRPMNSPCGESSQLEAPGSGQHSHASPLYADRPDSAPWIWTLLYAGSGLAET
jgi:hypothetical protein